MGLIKSAIGSALGADRVNNGLNAPKLPFINRKSASPTARHEQIALPHTQSYQNHCPPHETPPLCTPRLPQPTNYDSKHKGDEPLVQAQEQPEHFDECPSYNKDSSGLGFASTLDESIGESTERPRQNPGHGQKPWEQYSLKQHRLGESRTSCRPPQDWPSTEEVPFRPFVLPQVEYGNGRPFLRGYSEELMQLGISCDSFIRILDKINVGVIPNPEVQIFQKAANIAGYFIPGSASLGLMAGQFAVGVGAAFGHASLVGKTLSEANLSVFVPKGLEICIGRTSDVNNETQYTPATHRNAIFSPEDRIHDYGNSVARLDCAFPIVENAGRKDPIAAFGRGIGNRDDDRKLRRANKRMAKGKSKGVDALEGDLKWIIVRKATNSSLDHWRKTLGDCDTALKQERLQQRV